MYTESNYIRQNKLRASSRTSFECFTSVLTTLKIAQGLIFISKIHRSHTSSKDEEDHVYVPHS